MKKFHLYFMNGSKTHIYMTHIFFSYIIHILIFEIKFLPIFNLFLKFGENNFYLFFKNYSSIFYGFKN